MADNEALDPQDETTPAGGETTPETNGETNEEANDETTGTTSTKELAEVDELTTGDGRKVLSFSASGESYTIESTEQASKGRQAAAEAEMAEIKLAMMKRGILVSKMR